MKNITTVSVGIPAHNEEKNIENLLRGVLRQSKRNYVLNEVIVVCDGCTDRTAELVKKLSLKHPKIKLVNDGVRQGKASRLMYILKHHHSDILVLLDADVELVHNRVIEKLVRSFESDPSIGLVGGNDIPRPARSFFEKIVVEWITTWQRTARPICNWDNPHNCHGEICAMSSDFTRKVTIPHDVAADDHYFFYMAKELGFSFKFCRQASIYFKAPNNYDDLVKQSVRFGKSGSEVATMFKSRSLGYIIPMRAKVIEYSKGLLRDPFVFSLALLLQVIIKIKSRSSEHYYSHGIWAAVESSK